MTALLSDRDLLDALHAGELAVDPPIADQINANPASPSPLQPASLEVTLSNEFLVPVPSLPGREARDIDPRADNSRLFIRRQPVPAGLCLLLPPGGFVLGSTQQRFAFSASVAGQLSGKSSLARLGLQVHSTAGFIDPGFCGKITLELSNHGPWKIQLWPGMRVGQILVSRLSSPADRPYASTPTLGSRYQDQDGPTAPRRWRTV